MFIIMAIVLLVIGIVVRFWVCFWEVRGWELVDRLILFKIRFIMFLLVFWVLVCIIVLGKVCWNWVFRVLLMLIILVELLMVIFVFVGIWVGVINVLEVCNFGGGGNCFGLLIIFFGFLLFVWKCCYSY